MFIFDIKSAEVSKSYERSRELYGIRFQAELPPRDYIEIGNEYILSGSRYKPEKEREQVDLDLRVFSLTKQQLRDKKSFKDPVKFHFHEEVSKLNVWILLGEDEVKKISENILNGSSPKSIFISNNKVANSPHFGIKFLNYAHYADLDDENTYIWDISDKKNIVFFQDEVSFNFDSKSKKQKDEDGQSNNESNKKINENSKLLEYGIPIIIILLIVIVGKFL